MGNTDSIPVVSQVKSGVQLVCGDTEGAARTQNNFFHECPIVSQATSVVYLATGNVDEALETQKRCGKGLLNAADGIPVVGHAKGVIHYAVGDTEGGHRAMKSATRTTGVLAGGAGGFLLGGPVGAVAGGVYGGAVTDLGTSAVTQQPSGYVAAIENAIKNPNPGDIFDLCMMPVADGLAGHSAGSVVRRMTAPAQPLPSGSGAPQGQPSAANLVKAESLKAKAMAVYEAAEAKQLLVPEMETLTQMNKAAKLYQQATALEGKVAPPPLKPQVPTTSPAIVKVADIKASATTTTNQQKQRSKDKSDQGQSQSTRDQASAAAQGSASSTKTETRTSQRSTEDSGESSSDSEEEECTCDDITLLVLYANMQSINTNNSSQSMRQKLAKLRELIQRNRPAIVAIVETWLNSSHEDDQIVEHLGLEEYEIFRQDRDAGHPENNAYDQTSTGMEGRRGGGILIAWRQTDNLNNVVVERNNAEAFGDNIMMVDIKAKFRCLKCNESNNKVFGFAAVYRRPVPSGEQDAEETDQEVMNRLIHLGAMFTDNLLGYSGWCIAGDFNWRDGSNNAHFQELLMFVPDASVFPALGTGTHVRGGTLDQVYASNGLVTGLYVTPEPISDHHAFLFALNLGQDYPEDSPCEECEEED